MKIYTLLRVFLFISLFNVKTTCGAQGIDSINEFHKMDSIKSLPKEKEIKSGGRFETARNVLKDVLLSSPGDFGQMGKAINKDWRVTSAYVGGIAVLILADKPVTQWYQDNIERNIKYSLPKLPGSNKLFFRGNDVYLNYSLLGLYGGSLIANYQPGQRAALNSMKALTYSYIVTQVALKFLFARQRPDPTLSDGMAPRPPLTENPYKFFRFRKLNFKEGPDGTSFPSMHATAYYSLAKVLAMEFNNYYIPYGAITLIFFADLKSHQHWVGDMIAGGILGTVIGHGIVISSRLMEKKQKLKEQVWKKQHKVAYTYQVLPSISNQMVGLSLNVVL